MATDALNLTGIWLSEYEYESTGRGALKSTHRVAVVHNGDRLQVRSLPSSESDLSMDLAADGRVITGTWAERTREDGHYRGARYHGTVQMILNADGDRMTGAMGRVQPGHGDRQHGGVEPDPGGLYDRRRQGRAGNGLRDA